MKKTNFNLILNSKKKNALIQKDTCTPMFIRSLCTIAKIWKQPVSTDKSTVKEGMVNIIYIPYLYYIYIYVCVCIIEYYLAIKNKILPFAKA